MRNFENDMQLKSFLKKEAQRLNINITAAYTTYFARELLYRLSKQQTEDLILKGSSAEIAYLGKLVRAIIDIDIASPLPRSQGFATLISAITDKEENKINYEFSRPIKQTNTGVYQFSLVGEFGKIKQVVGIDYQDSYSRLIEPIHKVMPPIFEGDIPFELFMPSFEEFLAEKLCIIVESNKEDVLNTRVKDFYDIYQLHGGKYDSDKLTEYFKKMIKLRGKIDITEADTVMLDKEFIDKHLSVWDKVKDRYSFSDKHIDLSGAVYYTRGVIREQLLKSGMEMKPKIYTK